jgi:hypothetical protein
MNGIEAEPAVSIEEQKTKETSHNLATILHSEKEALEYVKSQHEKMLKLEKRQRKKRIAPI